MAAYGWHGGESSHSAARAPLSSAALACSSPTHRGSRSRRRGSASRQFSRYTRFASSFTPNAGDRHDGSAAASAARMPPMPEKSSIAVRGSTPDPASRPAPGTAKTTTSQARASFIADWPTKS